MKLVLILLVMTIGLTLPLKYSVAPKYGPDVAARFLERLNYIPSQKPPLLSRENLARWVGDPAQAAAKDGYAMPVLFPFDLLFMMCLSALLALASVLIVEHLRFLSGYRSGSGGCYLWGTWQPTSPKTARSSSSSEAISRSRTRSTG